MTLFSFATHFLMLSLGTGIGFILSALLSANKHDDDDWPVGV